MNIWKNIVTIVSSLVVQRVAFNDDNMFELCLACTKMAVTASTCRTVLLFDCTALSTADYDCYNTGTVFSFPGLILAFLLFIRVLFNERPHVVVNLGMELEFIVQ